ncbi:hypothetical protein HID58_037409 [Brassica napus]|uniref:Auxin-responsive protein n=1 Tax=Brassica napus TaxID=3708 RepID=A0ABQ8BLA8_BRANA|nr:hypothetical protein HID58_037409 [Brassica napus]
MRGGGSEFETGKSNLLPAESELELGLGLSIGGGAWRERGRILTAKDFPSVGSKRAADQSSSHQGQGASPPRSSQIVGWPPIGSHRMNKVNNQAPMKAAKEEEEEEEGKKKNDETKDVSVQGLGYVKVNMDGVGIGRKVDIRAHSSYENLAQTLEEMFFGMSGSTTSREKVKPLRLLDGSSEFVLTYEDKDGDWMLVGDVPWRMFVTSVKRLRIMGTSEANGLAQLRYVKEAEEIRLKMQPLELIKRVREIEQESSAGQETEQEKDVKQNTAVDLSKRLKDFRSLNDASSLKGFGGNGATPFFLTFSILAAVIGIASKLAGANHIRFWRNDSLAAAGSSSIVAWAVTALAMGLACKQINIGGWRGWRLRIIEAFIIILTFTQLLYVLLIHAGVFSSKYGPGYRDRDYATGQGHGHVPGTHAGEHKAGVGTTTMAV